MVTHCKEVRELFLVARRGAVDPWNNGVLFQDLESFELLVVLVVLVVVRILCSFFP